MFLIIYRCPETNEIFAQETTDCWDDVQAAQDELGDLCEVIVNS